MYTVVRIKIIDTAYRVYFNRQPVAPLIDCLVRVGLGCGKAYFPRVGLSTRWTFHALQSFARKQSVANISIARAACITAVQSVNARMPMAIEKMMSSIEWRSSLLRVPLRSRVPLRTIVGRVSVRDDRRYALVVSLLSLLRLTRGDQRLALATWLVVMAMALAAEVAWEAAASQGRGRNATNTDHVALAVLVVVAVVATPSVPGATWWRLLLLNASAAYLTQATAAAQRDRAHEANPRRRT